MRKIKLGTTDVSSSIMGFGCMGMSEFYGSHDEESSFATLERAFDLGITHYDTSNVYGRGDNERLVGQFAKDKRDRITIATKFGVVRDPDGPEGSTYDRGIDNSPDYVRQCCEESLQRLGVDVIDLYYVHRLDPNAVLEDTMGALSRLVEEGKVRAVGLSEVTADQLRRANAVHPVAALQSEYSLWSRDVEHEILPLCKEIGTTFVAYSPLGRGFLTGKIQSASDLEEGDIRHTSPRFKAENIERNKRLLARLEAFCKDRNISLTQMALAFVMNQSQDIVPIPGTKRIKYLEENASAVDVRLSAEDLAALDEIMPIGAAAGEAYDPKYGGAPKMTGGGAKE